jgi:hypothetical protein
VGITATAFLSMNDMDYDQYRPALLFKNKLAFIHVVVDLIFTSPISNDGLCDN